ncbi:MAG: hypothetical protein AB1599_06665 [Planctomycetota bacterium]
MTTLTIIAVVLSSVVVLITLAKISRQLDGIINYLKKIDKELLSQISHEDISASQIQKQLGNLTKELKTKKGDIDWKG